MTAANEMLFAALKAAAQGVLVYPIDPMTNKPLVIDPATEATDDPEIIEGWWQKYPTALIGIIKRPQISATRFAMVDPRSIPRRQWLYGRHLIRGFVSVTIAPGGVGKSSLTITQSLAMVSGKDLLGIAPANKLRVWIWNGEDPSDELLRRVTAACVHYELDASDVDGLFLDSGRQMPMVLAEQTRNGTEVAQSVIDAIVRTAQDNRIDCIIIDPFVATHRVNENDNTAMDLVVKAWGQIAERTNAGIELIHHSRKMHGGDTGVEDARGASALIAAARSAVVLNSMKAQEATKAGLESYRGYFRVDSGKANLAPPSDQASWFQLKSVRLHNGDDVAVVVPWSWPNPLETVSVADLRAAQHAVASGGPWRENCQAKEWVGKPIAEALKLDLENPVQKARIKSLLKIWTATGMFVVVNGVDSKRNPRSFVEVGEWATD
jgi:hypothetical protein